MAYLARNRPDDTQTQPISTGGGGGVLSGPGSGGSSPAAPAAGQGSGAGLSDLSAYLAANGDQAAGLVSSIMAPLDSGAQAASQARSVGANGARADARSALGTDTGTLLAARTAGETAGEQALDARLFNGAGGDASMAALRAKYADLLNPITQGPRLSAATPSTPAVSRTSAGAWPVRETLDGGSPGVSPAATSSGVRVMSGAVPTAAAPAPADTLIPRFQANGTGYGGPGGGQKATRRSPLGGGW